MSKPIPPVPHVEALASQVDTGTFIGRQGSAVDPNFIVWRNSSDPDSYVEYWAFRGGSSPYQFPSSGLSETSLHFEWTSETHASEQAFVSRAKQLLGTASVECYKHAVVRLGS